MGSIIVSKTVQIIVSAEEVLNFLNNYGIDTKSIPYDLLIAFIDEYFQRTLFNELVSEESLIQRLMSMGIAYPEAQELYLVLHDCFGCNIHRLISMYNDGSMSIVSYTIHHLNKIEIQLKENPKTNRDLDKASLIDMLRMDLLEGIERGDYFNERYKKLLDGSANHFYIADS